MSELVCYIERAERGLLPLRLRLISTRVEEAWSFPEMLADDRAALQRGLREAADWIAAQLKTHARAGLGALVLDPDGSRCGWVSTHTTDPDALGALLRQAGEPMSEEEAAHTVGSTPQLALSPDVRIPGAAAFQPLGVQADQAPPRRAPFTRPAQAGPQQRHRLGVAAVTDSTVRLLLDELDARNVSITRVVTTWHALVEAFDGADARRTDRVVAASAGTAAQVMIDPVSGRLVWAWSRGGAPVAAGAFRLLRGAPGAEGLTPITFGRPELARLASEWIAWSTQLGASPTRVRMVLPAESWADPASLGESVAAVWPGATSDIAFDDEPLAMVLSRFADGLGDPRLADDARQNLTQLQTRPGRQHRSMYRWAACAIAIAAGAMGVAAFRVHSSASDAAAQADDARRAWRKAAGELLPEVNLGQIGTPPYDGVAIQDLQTALETRRRAVAPVAATPEKPVLQELETLSYVLGNPDYQLQQIRLTSTAVTIDIIVPDTAAYEELIDSLERIAGSAVGTWQQTPRQTGTGVRATFTGLWSTSRPTSGGGA